MARKKIKIQIKSVNDLADAGNALEFIAAYEREIEHAQTLANAAIDRIKKRAAETMKPFADSIEAWEGGLAQYAEREKNTLFSKKKRSREFTHGTIGFRKSTPLKTLKGWTWGKVLDALLRKKEKAGVRVNYSVDKDALHKWNDKCLEAVGVFKKPKDEFFYEIKKEELKKT